MIEKIKASPNYRWFVAASVFIGTFMSTLVGSIVNVALPTISAQFSSDLSLLQWVVSAYLLTTSSLLPIFGRISDLFGCKRVFSIGFLIFTIGSALCAISINIWFLIGARIVKAIGAAMLMSNNFAIISSVFPSNERGRALGMSGAVVALGSMTGPPLGGLLVEAAGWRLIFYINLPIGILGYIFSLIILPADNLKSTNERFDFLGAAFFALSMILLLLSINNGSNLGWQNPIVISGIALGVALFAAFLITENKVKYPMIDLSLFKIPPFLIGNVAGGMSFIAMFSNNMIMPFYLQQVLNYQPSQVGLMMMAFPIMMAISAPLSGYLSDKFGPLILTTCGLGLLAAGLFYLSMLSAASQFYNVIPGPILMGIGSGLFQSPNNSNILNSVPANKTGITGAINSLVRNVGMMLGITFSVTLFEAMGGVSAPAPNQIGAFMAAYRIVLIAAAAVALAAMFISLSRKAYVTAK